MYMTFTKNELLDILATKEEKVLGWIAEGENYATWNIILNEIAEKRKWIYNLNSEYVTVKGLE